MKEKLFSQFRNAGRQALQDLDVTWRKVGKDRFLKGGHFMRRLGAELIYACDQGVQWDERAEAARSDIQSVLDAYRISGTMAEIGTHSPKIREIRMQRGATDALTEFRPTDLHWVRVEYRGFTDGNASVNHLLVHSEDSAPRYGYSAHCAQQPSNLYSVFFVPLFNRWALGRSLHTSVSSAHTLTDETWQLVLSVFERFAEGESLPRRIEGLPGQEESSPFWQGSWNLAPDIRTDRQRARQLIGCIAQRFKNRPASATLSAS